MVRRSLLIFIIVVSFLHLQAQRVELMFSAGLAGYSMGDLKKINADLQVQIPFRTQVTTNFPMTWQLGGHFAVQLSNKYKIGVLYAWNSTGSRIASSDYSGSYRFDNIVTGHTIGMLNGFRIYDYHSLRVDLEANIGLVASFLKLNEEMNVADTTFSSTTHYSAFGFFLEPRAVVSYQWKYLKAGFFIGYFVNSGGKIRNEDGEKSTTTINWSGLRFGIELGVHQINR
ncbi:MAG: hypothetical protein NT004_02900 [Bacteroidetes bacterium]|nr:hypothetical protein [Bacteroidota bacterium]